MCFSSLHPLDNVFKKTNIDFRVLIDTSLSNFKPIFLDFTQIGKSTQKVIVNLIILFIKTMSSETIPESSQKLCLKLAMLFSQAVVAGGNKDSEVQSKSP